MFRFYIRKVKAKDYLINCCEYCFHGHAHYTDAVKAFYVVSFHFLPIQMLLQLKWSMAWVHHVFTWGAGLAGVSCLHQGNFAGNWLHPHLTPCWEVHRPMHPGQLLREGIDLEKNLIRQGTVGLSCISESPASWCKTISNLWWYDIQRNGTFTVLDVHKALFFLIVYILLFLIYTCIYLIMLKPIFHK